MTINRKGISKSLTKSTDSESKDSKVKINRALENLKTMAQSGQHPREDVIEIANMASKRFYKFFWFNPKFDAEEEDSYEILENLFTEGFWVDQERILFGSDALVSSTLEIEFLKILSLPISNIDKQNILYNNTSRLIEGN